MPQNKTRSLPPGVEDDPVFGKMWIKAGTLKLIRSSKAEYSVICQFWGQQSAARIKTRSDMPNNQHQRTQIYQVRCPVIYFAQYLKEMKQNLRLEVEGVGKVTIDISKFMNQKKQVTIDSRQAFEHFNGFFQIIGTGSRKAGSIQIQMGCSFDPQIAYQQLGEQAINQMRQSYKSSCPANTHTVQGCNGTCICHQLNIRKLGQVDVRQQERDQRIPHSLDIEQRPQEQFDAEKYNKPDSPVPQNLNVKKEEIKQLAPQQDNENMQQEGSKQFPQIPQILTYSRLRLDYEEPNQNGIPHKEVSEEECRQIEESERVQEISQKPETMAAELKSSDKNLKKIETPLQKLMDSAEDDNSENNQLYRQFYEGNARQKGRQNIIENQEDAGTPNHLLSRVINLDEELLKQSQIKKKPIGNPPALEYDFRGNKFEEDPIGPTFRKIAGPSSQKNLPVRNSKESSSLLLNFIVEISTKSIIFNSSKSKFTIAYRPYGTKQRTTSGPNFGEKVTILNTVGQNQVRKMDKMPFIVQFWDSVTGKFLGLAKINLSKIKKGFILNNRLNAISIKTNLYPTVIHRGVHSLKDISDAEVGSCQLYAAIGTSSQLNLYLNNPDKFTQEPEEHGTKMPSPEKDRPQKQKLKEIQEIKQEQWKISHNPEEILMAYDKFFLQINQQSSAIVNELLPLARKQVLQYKDFKRIFKGLEKWEQIYHWMNTVLYKQLRTGGGIPFKDLSSCFDDFKEMEVKIAAGYKKSSRELQKYLKQEKEKSNWLKRCKQFSQFYRIKKNKLRDLLLQIKVDPRIVDNYLQYFGEQANIESISASLKIDSHEPPTILEIDPSYFTNLITEEIYHRLLVEQIDADVIAKKFNNSSSVSIHLLGAYLKGQGVQCSSWILVHLFKSIRKMFEVQDTQNLASLSLSHLYNWCVLMQRKSVIKENSVLQDSEISENKQSRKQSQPANEAPQQVKPLNPNIDHIEKESEEIKKQKKENEKKEEEKEQNQHSDKQNKSIEANKEGQQKQKEISPIFRHLFTLQPFELQLQSPISGNCQVFYLFPFEQEQIKSKNFQTLIDKHKYGLKMFGTHGFSIQDAAENYLGDNLVKFLVKIDGRIEYEGAMHVDELLIQANSKQVKIIPLFSDRIQGMAGKLKINLEYEKGLNSENTLGKQTTYQLFLPKNGFLNYEIQAEINHHKIKNQLNIKEEFYVALVLDVFYQAPNLKSLFPPISSKLFSAPKSIDLSGSLKLHLSTLILEYIKEKSSKLSLNIIYYSKERGNFQRKQVPYAFIELPMINVIKSDGISGDYAFKNKLGMFVSLAKCNLKYDKDNKNSNEVNKFSIDRNRQNFWVLLNFLEFINFERSSDSINWIKFQFILKGKKYSTEKTHIQHDAIAPLKNSFTLLHLSEEDFHDLKLIPITIYTNNTERFAIDINLKAVSQQLTHQKYSINNQYFVVVNQSSECVKMRVGLKIYAFRGSPILSSFIDSLSHNLQTEVFNQLVLPEEIREYDKMLSIFKRNLKLTTRSLDEALNELLISKHRDKLSFDFFTNRTYYKLDFTPIVVDLQSRFEFITEYLPGEVSGQQIDEYIKDNNISLSNFRPEFLERFRFKQLNKSKVDKNVEFLGISDKIDLMSFVRKIKIHDPNQQSQLPDYHNQTQHNQTNLSAHYRELTINILEGNNFHQLYNGIKPNALVRIPDLGLETQVITRNSNPFFNQTFNEIVDSQLINGSTKLRVEVYHCSDDQNILIGQGMFNFPLLQLKQLVPKSSKIIRVILSSTMSSKLKATLNIKLNFGQTSKIHPEQNSMNYPDSLMDENSHMQSNDASRLDQIMHQIKNEMNYKGNLFESSDDQY